MLILSIRTDQPEAELGLYSDSASLATLRWPAHRQLAESIHQQISDLLHSRDKEVSDIQAIAAFQGPGSFTGLRIGLSVANALAAGLKIPITSGSGPDWAEKCIQRLLAGENQEMVLPEYGAAPHVTQPRSTPRR